jgi:hypothetical protein
MAGILGGIRERNKWQRDRVTALVVIMCSGLAMVPSVVGRIATGINTAAVLLPVTVMKLSLLALMAKVLRGGSITRITTRIQRKK